MRLTLDRLIRLKKAAQLAESVARAKLVRLEGALRELEETEMALVEYISRGTSPARLVALQCQSLMQLRKRRSAIEAERPAILREVELAKRRIAEIGEQIKQQRARAQQRLDERMLDDRVSWSAARSR